MVRTPPVDWLVTKGRKRGSSSTSRGSRTTNAAPSSDPDRVATPPIRIMARNWTDSSRLKVPGSMNPVIVGSSAPAMPA